MAGVHCYLTGMAMRIAPRLVASSPGSTLHRFTSLLSLSNLTSAPGSSRFSVASASHAADGGNGELSHNSSRQGSRPVPPLGPTAFQQQVVRRMGSDAGVCGGGADSLACTELTCSPSCFLQWHQFLLALHRHGHYAADAGVTVERVDADSGAVKRAVLSMARTRPGLLGSLPTDSLRQLLETGAPSQERKVVNAWKRLDAVLVQSQSQARGDVAPELQDVLRLLLALAEQDTAAPEAAAVLLRDIVRLWEQQPGPTSAGDAACADELCCVRAVSGHCRMLCGP